MPIPGVPIPQRNRDRQARLHDSVRFSIFHYLKRDTGRKALLIVALSDDQHSESTLEDALIALQQNDVIAYVVQVTDGPHDNCDVFHIFSEGKRRNVSIAGTWDKRNVSSIYVFFSPQTTRPTRLTCCRSQE